ncbi:AraC family transcriptional regulator ligand-binding domain-containing protein [Thalassotalea sp. LPB0316]|uniref:AraC family transcriptional regulator n=1 Tax=Thalassotalea sp. LPB0316 TaxID=2769490 RepID=UPI001868D489|nr:AraC family transcriptional regulator [Thalassotalea sp. LPB0316]QOL24515.1 AraC family transcriptional regulator ligand-binding domain-containing protein [Thalassotalea sp. LPB0316]
MQYQVPQYGVKSLVNYLCQQGLDKQVLLNILATDEQSFIQSQSVYSLAQYEALFSYGQAHLPIKNLGFHFGQAFDLGIWGILGHIVVAAPNLLDALAYQKRYQCLIGNVGQAEHETDGDSVIMRYIAHPDASINNIEHVITAWLTYAFSYTRNDDAPVSVHFTHECPSQLEEYQDYFRCKVVFGDNFNGVKIKQYSLLHPIVSANDDVLKLLLSHAEQLLAAKRQKASIDIIREYIIEQLPNGVPSLDDVAQHLELSSRQLQRKFQQEQTNLSQLIESIRQQLAISYLSQTNHKLLYISTILGYSEQSAFQRAFKRWFGLTPQAYRQKPIPLMLN